MRIKNYLFALLLIIISCNDLLAQNRVPFTTRFDQDLRGDMLLIGNNILNRTGGGGPNNPYNGTNNNGAIGNMGYVDIDTDATTFNSSSADLTVPNPTCRRVVYAGLYWGALIQGTDDRSQIPNVKLKLPVGGYNDIVGTIIHDAGAAPLSGNKPYACYANITALVTSLANPDGTYTVANVASSIGQNGGTGLSAGWSIFVVYEDPSLVSKAIVSFDGFSGINGTTLLNIPITGFRTIPSGPVRAQFAITGLEGDLPFTGDYLNINGNPVSSAVRPATNFFNSSITTPTGVFTARNPNGSNTLGYDAGIQNINNPGNLTIANNATAATVTIGTAGDTYFYFFNAMAVEIIEPSIVLTKTLETPAGAPIADNTPVVRCQDVVYVIGFQNIGNDDATNFTIRDVLPPNVFLPNGAADLILPPGVTATYNAVTREAIFTINPSLVNIGDPRFEIRIRARVACLCSDLDDACSNVLTNQAYSTYQGVINTTQITEDPSLANYSACNVASPSPTIRLIDLSGCSFVTDSQICGNNPITLTAANGYSSYVWTGPAPSTTVIGNSQTLVVTAPGVYTVNDIISTSPCQSIVQTFNVTDFGIAALTNPVIPFADQVLICPTDGLELPNIFLCGLSDSQLITTSISGATITWAQLNTASCAAVTDPNCANTNAACVWTTLSTGPNFTATTAGQYSVTIDFSGCSRTFYFNVFQNILNPTATPRDILCTTTGQITVNGVPAGYEYQLNCTGAWQTSNVFNPVGPGTYSVCIRQIGVPTGCNFTVTNIPVRLRNFTVTTTITQPLCFGQLGSINIAANDALPQYTFSIFRQPGNILVATVGPTAASNNLFSNINPGTYTYTVTTQDGCNISNPFTINGPPLLTATIALTRPLTDCGPGEITVYPLGGTPPYNYIVTGAVTVTQGSPVIAAPVAGTYNVQIVDFNNCSVNVSLPVNLVPAPVYTVTQTNVLCYGNNTGAINFNVTSTNGFTLAYSIDGTNFFPTPNFPNLVAGTYTIIVRYTLGTAVCLTTPATITITQPASALTASAGVSELAGCGPSGEGKVRIINPQGGVPGYTYSFNNGATYTGVNEAYLLPGTYTVYIQDTNGCIFPMTVILDPPPTPPTIIVSPPVFACNGTSTSTITVNNNGGNFAYTYFLDNNSNTPPTNNIFTNVPCGPHTVRVNYQAINIPTPSNLLFEDFGVGANTTTPGINTAYCFENQSGIHPVGYTCNLDNFINDGEYGVTSRINPRFGVWNDPRDHTTNGVNPLGRFLCVNIGGTAGIGGIIYSKPINDIIPNQDIQVSLWAMNLIRNTAPALGDPNLTIQLIANLGLPGETLVATTPVASPIVVPKSNAWQFYNLALNPGAYTSLSFVIRSYSNVINGNDVVIDDINVFQVPIACVTTRDFPINIACNQAFAAQVTGSNNVSCNGGNNGTITIAAQNFAPTGFQYSTNGGTTWITSTVSPVTITGLNAATYNIQIRYDSNPANSACTFPFTTVITQPAVLTPSVIVTPATCLTGATITASAVGGTTAYQYQLQTSPGATIIRPYQASGIFTNVPAGSYVVLIQDANLCTSTSIIVNVVAPTLPTLALSAAPPSDFCYDSINGSTLIVTASGGLAPYSFSIGGSYQASNTPVNSHTFANLVPGNYTISVLDANGCTNTVPFTQTINPQLTLSTVFTKDLDCTTSPNAVFTSTIGGGYSPYTIQLSFNAGVFVNLGAATSPFTYSTAVPGTYQFQVTDTRGCIAQSGIFTVNPLIPVAATQVQVNNVCFGNTAGSVVITPSGGVGPYQINFNSLGFSATFTYTGLAAGTYNYIVTDSKSCTFNGSVTITEPTQIAYTAVVNPIQCSLSGTYTLGSICVNGLMGGIAPYTYTLVDLTGGAVIPNHVDATGANFCFTNIDFGLYDLSVTDANGCTIVKSNLIMSNPPSDLTFVISPLPGTCAGGATVDVTLTGSLGPGPYEFGIVNLSAFPWSSTFVLANNPVFGHQFTGLTPGAIYTIVVRDLSTGCYYFEQMTASTPTNSILNVTPLVANPVPCRLGANGSVTFSLTGINAGTTSISYSVHFASNNLPVGAATTGTLTAPFTMFPFTTGPLAPGTYNIQFTENGGPISGCGVTSANFTIVQSATDLTLTATTTNDNCNVNAGQIAPNPVGGTGPYTFQYLPAGFLPAPIATSPGWVTTNPFNGESGNYDVYALDAFGCIRMVTVTIGLDPSPVIAATLVNACVAQGTYEINVAMPVTGVAPYTFSIDGPSAFVTNTTPFTISGLSSGVHTVQVRDRNGCGNTVSVTILTPLIVSAVFTTQPTCFNSNGTITASASGGSASANYTYTLLTPALVVIAGPQASTTFINQPAGSYIIRVTDSVTGCSANTPFSLVLPTPVTFAAVPTSVTCSGGNDGTITINLTGASDNPPYTYQIIAGPLTPPVQSLNVFTGLPAGTYTVQVNSGRGCQLIDNNVIVGTPNPIAVPATTITLFACSAGTNAVNLATITVNGVTGGSGVYTNYQFILGGVIQQSGSSNTYSTANAAGGTYTINVFDNKGCLGTTTAVINPYISISNPTVFVDFPITCTTNEQITITVTVAGGAPPVFTYTVTGYPTNVIPYNVTQNTPTFTGLTIGDYLITVLNPVTGCSVQTIHYVFNPNTFSLLINNIVDVTCIADNNGSANITIIDNDVTPTNDAGSFNYTILDSLGATVASGVTASAGPLTIPGLPSGIYTANATLVNPPRCSVTQNFTISGPTSALSVVTNSTPITCVAGNNDGTITASATGGWGAPYEFQLQIGASIVVPYSSNPNFTGLTFGTYTVYVRDARGCILPSTNVTLTNPTTINANVTAASPNLACFGDTTSITISNITGGQGSNYSYTIKGPLPSTIQSGAFPMPASGTVTIPGLAVGVYDVEISDGWSCSNDFSVTISQPAIVEGNLSITATQTCNVQTVLTLTGSGGTPPYSYSTSTTGTFTLFLGPTTTTISVPVGTHFYYIRDANGCLSALSNGVTIEALTPLTLSSITDVDILCGGSNTGSITTVATGGLLNYIYTLLDSAGVPIAGATQSPAGTFINLPQGNYLVNVTSLDCTYTTPVVIAITEPTPFTVVPTPIDVKCNAGTDGQVNLIIAGGTGTIQYAISPNLDQFFTIADPYNPAGFNIPGLSFGTYSVIVQDQNGCVANFNVNINQPAPIAATINGIVNEDCAEDNIGEFTVTGITGGTAPYNVTYSVELPNGTIVNGPIIILPLGDTDHTFVNLDGGIYTILVSDANDCPLEIEQIIGSGTLFDPFAQVSFPCVDNQPAVRVEVINLSNPSSFTFNPLTSYSFSLDVNNIASAQASNIFTSDIYPAMLTPGLHTIYVFGPTACNQSTTFTVLANDIDPLTLVLNQGGLNEIVAESTGGSGGNNYTFNSYNNGSDNTYVYDATGDYTVTVTDSSGCSVTLTEPFVFIPIKIPDVFSPDGNGNNDGWGPTNTSNYPNLVTKIYDRYGRLVKELKEGEFWDGKYNNQELPTGDYWYVIKVDGSDADEYVGHFTLYR